jgi:hypothetical protein
MWIVIVGKKDETRIIRWSRVAGLALGLSLILGFLTGYVYRLLSGEWDPLPCLLGVSGGIVVVGVGLVNALNTPMNRLAPVK